MSERCWAEIESAALRHNARVARERSQSEVVAIVKANAYGHGLAQVANILREEVDVFGVANLHEGAELQESGIRQPILLLGPALPEEREEIVRRGFIASVSSAAEARAFGPGAIVTFVIDTGMGRIGSWHTEAAGELQQIVQTGQVKLHSIATHLPVADEDRNFTEEQLTLFDQLVNQLRGTVPGSWKVHALASAGIFGFARHRFEFVRAGLMLYGSSPLPNEQQFLRPVMTLKTHVVLVRDLPAGRSVSYGRTFVTPKPMRVATISAGYADGFPRSLSNQGATVLIGGRRCPVVGRVTMDLTMADVSNAPDIQVGSEVVLFGKQEGEEIFAAEVAAEAGTIAWEFFTGIGSRVRRVYL